jgi:hypothetical protein
VENLKKIISSSKTFLEVREKINDEYGFLYSKGKIKEFCDRSNISYSHLFDEIWMPTKEELLEIIEKIGGINKNKIAEYFNVPWQHIDIYLKNYNIKTERYSGTIKKPDDLNQFIEDAKTLTRFQLSKKYNVSISVIKRWGKENNISIKKESDNWKHLRKEYDLLKEKVIELNKIYDCVKIAEILNLPYTRIRKIFRRNKIPVISHSYNKSKGELEVKDFINSLGVECISRKFTYKDKCFEIDCFCPEFNFGIEYCGEYWHSSEQKEKNYHQYKTIWFQEQEIKLITIFENEWYNKNDIIKSIIKNNLGKTENKIMARKCEIKEILNSEARKFMEENHIQGYYNSTVNIGLIYQENLVQVICFSASRFNKNFEWEITRIASKINNNIIGGTSRLYSYFEKIYKPSSIISYADLRFSEGKIYKTLGFDFLHMSAPNYFYIKKGDHKLYSRQKFQKHKLEKILPIFDVNISEKENMKNNDYLLIYDAGNLAFQKTYK